jgi:PAS domain S-box-containing protein
MKHSERLVAAQTEDGRYRLLIEAVTDYAIFMLDPTGIITTWNPGAQRIKGYIASEILGKHFSQFYTEEDQKKGFRRAALETAQREGKFEGEGWRLRQDGTRFWAHVIIDAIHDDDGGFLGYAKITRDITERRDAQQRLEKTREALLQSQKKEAIGQLTGGIAHDFNNLLMAVLSSLELMRKRLPDDPKLLGLLENALQGAHRGASLTQRMLAFAAPAGTQTRGDQYPVTGTRNDRPHSAVAGPIDQHRNALSACDPAGAGRPHATGDGVAVDDDFLILTNTIAILEDLGHTALAASSDKEAIGILKTQPTVDLVITDQAMPHMTGLQLVEVVEQSGPISPSLPLQVTRNSAKTPERVYLNSRSPSPR